MPPIDSATSEAINSVYRMIMEGDVTGASMMAQEVLSDVFGQWHRMTPVGGGADGMRLAGSLLLASTAYAETLLKRQQPKAAYNAVMTALAYTARIDDAEPGVRLMALLTSWAAVEQMLTATSPSGPGQQRDIQIVARGLGSLLYRQYYLTGQSDPENAALTDAYQTLRVLQSVVEIDPEVEDPVALLGEILNASQTAGLLE